MRRAVCMAGIMALVLTQALAIDWVHPLGWEGERTSGQGLRQNPMGGSLHRFHDGVDWAAPVGTPVVAAAAGRVIEYYLPEPGDQVYGGMVRLEHEDGSTSLYGHLSRVDVRLGWYCWQGRQLGAVGSTGLSTGPHLHFETTTPIVFAPAPEPRDELTERLQAMVRAWRAAPLEERNVVP